MDSGKHISAESITKELYKLELSQAKPVSQLGLDFEMAIEFGKVV